MKGLLKRSDFWVGAGSILGPAIFFPLALFASMGLGSALILLALSSPILVAFLGSGIGLLLRILFFEKPEVTPVRKFRLTLPDEPR